MVRIYRVVMVLFFGLGLALGLVCAMDVFGQPPTGDHNGLDLVILIDNSPSMITADSGNQRVNGARLIVDYLRADANMTGAFHRIGVANFGKEIGKQVSLTAPQDGIRNAIQPESLPSTDFVVPLRFARDEFRRAKSRDSGRSMAIILLTDGQPEPRDRELSEDELIEYFDPEQLDEGSLAAVLRELQQSGVQIFVLGLGEAQENMNDWAKLIPRNQYIPIVGPRNMPDAYHDSVARLLDVTPSRGRVLPSARESVLTVEPYLDWVGFSFVNIAPETDSTTIITLTNPLGTPVPPTSGQNGGGDLVYSVLNPAEGNWKVLRQGPGEIRFWVEGHSPVVRLAITLSTPYVGSPIPITANLIRNGTAVTTEYWIRSGESVPTETIKIDAEIVRPDGGRAVLHLVHRGGGDFGAAYNQADLSGIYTVTAKVFVGDYLLRQARSSPVHVDLRFFPSPTPTSRPTEVPTPTRTPTPTPTPIPPPEPGLFWHGPAHFAPEKPLDGQNVTVTVPFTISASTSILSATLGIEEHGTRVAHTDVVIGQEELSGVVRLRCADVEHWVQLPWMPCATYKMLIEVFVHVADRPAFRFPISTEIEVWRPSYLGWGMWILLVVLGLFLFLLTRATWTWLRRPFQELLDRVLNVTAPFWDWSSKWLPGPLASHIAWRRQVSQGLVAFKALKGNDNHLSYSQWVEEAQQHYAAQLAIIKRNPVSARWQGLKEDEAIARFVMLADRQYERFKETSIGEIAEMVARFWDEGGLTGKRAASLATFQILEHRSDNRLLLDMTHILEAQRDAIAARELLDEVRKLSMS
ncbi:MAG: VWA domain-containing protein [Chloroflexi bacterium]|nr:VWA domain-containing protein [Chloroflexota bacterium]